MPFDLQALVDRTLDRSLEADPHQLARNILMRIAPADREEALLLALAAYTEARIYERQGIGWTTTPSALIDD